MAIPWLPNSLKHSFGATLVRTYHVRGSFRMEG